MNTTIQELFDRKSVRVFEDREMLAEEKHLILEAATMAPTAGNQHYEIGWCNEQLCSASVRC